MVDPTRRRVLAVSGLAVLAGAGVTGCAGSRAWPWASPPSPAPDVAVLARAIRAEEALIARYAAVIAAVPALGGTASPLLRQHREHLGQLRERLVVPAGTPRSPATASPPPPAHVPAGQDAALGYLRSAETDQASRMISGIAAATPSLAQLMASIGACEAAHAALLAAGAGGPAGPAR